MIAMWKKNRLQLPFIPSPLSHAPTLLIKTNNNNMQISHVHADL